MNYQEAAEEHLRKMDKMRSRCCRAIVSLSVFTELLKGPNYAYKSDLPDDVQVVAIRPREHYMDPLGSVIKEDEIDVILWSESFDPVPENCEYPKIDIVITTESASKTYTQIADSGPDCNSPLVYDEGANFTEDQLVRISYKAAQSMRNLGISLDGIDPEMDESDDEPAGGFDTGRFIEESRKTSLDYFREKM